MSKQLLPSFWFKAMSAFLLSGLLFLAGTQLSIGQDSTNVQTVEDSVKKAAEEELKKLQAEQARIDSLIEVKKKEAEEAAAKLEELQAKFPDSIPQEFSVPELPTVEPTLPQISPPTLGQVLGMIPPLLYPKVKAERSAHIFQLERVMTAAVAQGREVKYTDAFWHKQSDITYTKPLFVRDSSGAFRDTLMPDITIYGFHPFWMGDAWKSYYFRLISRIGYYGYIIDPYTGDPVHDIEQGGADIKAMVAAAHQYNTKIDLVVACYDDDARQLFYSNDPKVRDAVMDKTLQLMQAWDMDGINIDIQNVPERHRSRLASFVNAYNQKLEQLNQQLQSKDTENMTLQERKEYSHPRRYRLTLTLPPFDEEGSFAIDEMDSLDHYIMSSYDYRSLNNKMAGPVSILYGGAVWGGRNIETGINDWLKAGVPRTRLILAVPYYGQEWTARSKYPGARFAKLNNLRDYRYIKENYFVERGEQDQDSRSMYQIFAYGKKWRHFWWDDEKSLAEKYDYVLQKKIGGAGIWALGYDNGHHDLWRLLRKKFTLGERRVIRPQKKVAQDTTVVVDETRKPKHIRASWKSLAQVYPVDDYSTIEPDTAVFLAYSNYFLDPVNSPDRAYVTTMQLVEILTVALLILAAFAAAGFLLSMADHDVRELFWKRSSQVFGLTYVGLFTLILLLHYLGVLPQGGWSKIIFMALLGVLFIYLVVMAWNRFVSSRGEASA